MTEQEKKVLKAFFAGHIHEALKEVHAQEELAREMLPGLFKEGVMRKAEIGRKLERPIVLTRGWRLWLPSHAL